MAECCLTLQCKAPPLRLPLGSVPPPQPPQISVPPPSPPLNNRANTEKKSRNDNLNIFTNMYAPAATAASTLKTAPAPVAPDTTDSAACMPRHSRAMVRSASTAVTQAADEKCTARKDEKKASADAYTRTAQTAKPRETRQRPVTSSHPHPSIPAPPPRPYRACRGFRPARSCRWNSTCFFF